MTQLFSLRILFFFLIAITIIPSCSTSGPGLFSKKTPHQQYGDKISNAGLRQTTLGSLWFNAAEQALAKPITISLPYRETGYFPAEKPTSAGFRFTARRGEALKIVLQKKPVSGFSIYMDLWQSSGSNDRPKLLESGDSSNSPINYEVGDESEFILRIQPELLKGGEYTVTISTGPSLAFPVPAKAKPNVGSFWGAGRDNGVRRHEGIDIFAPHRTPVIAAADGYVTRVEETPIGGKVVWLRPENKPFTLYYAHLDTQIAQPGQPVRAGDTLGLMGNTGNAKSTATHLHFGIYAIGGAVDPLPFVNQIVRQPEAVTAALDGLGKKARTENRSRIYLEADAKSGSFATLEPASLITLSAATKNWYKVQLPSGEEGFIQSSLISNARNPIRKITLKNSLAVLDQPDSLAARKLLVSAGSTINVLANYKTFYYVNTGDIEGWMLKSGL